MIYLPLTDNPCINTMNLRTILQLKIKVNQLPMSHAYKCIVSLHKLLKKRFMLAETHFVAFCPVKMYWCQSFWSSAWNMSAMANILASEKWFEFSPRTKDHVQQTDSSGILVKVKFTCTHTRSWRFPLWKGKRNKIRTQRTFHRLCALIKSPLLLHQYLLSFQAGVFSTVSFGV